MLYYFSEIAFTSLCGKEGVGLSGIIFLELTNVATLEVDVAALRLEVATFYFSNSLLEMNFS